MIRDLLIMDNFTIIILVNLFLILTSKLVDLSKFNSFLYIYINNSFLRYNNSENNFFNGFNLLLTTNFLLSISLYITIISSYINEIEYFNFKYFIKIFVILSIFYFFRFIIEHLLGWAFNIRRFIKSFNFQKNSFNKYLGIILVLINSLLIYSYSSSLIAINISLFLIVLLYLSGLFKIVTLNDNLIYPNLFYFILYLCTLEIIPILYLIQELV